MSNLTVLHLHSMDSNPYSGLEVDSITPFQAYIDKAKEEGMKAIAFTEHGAVLHNVAKRQACEKAGLKYINAEEFYVTEKIDMDNLQRDNYHCCLYAKNYDGVLELNKLSSDSFNRNDGHFYYNPRITLEELENTSDNILVLTACVAGMLCKGTKEVQERFLKFLIKNKHRCWLEIQPHNFDVQIYYNQYLYRIAQKYGMKLIAMVSGAIRPAGESYREQLFNGIYKDNGNEALNEFLKPTLGYLVYQEQIIDFLHDFCGFTMGQADIVRRHFAKKTGTEADIPIIENGGYMVDIHGNKDDRYIPGFIAIAQEKYGMTKAEAREAIKSFLVVIEDASNYLFSRNHSVPYSMIGLFIGWLRYYHKIELLTSALNVYVDNNEKMSNIKEYIKSQGIEIKGIKFGKSKAQYFMDKDENAIYQGISSIKYCNDQIADELYELSKNHYDNFVDLLSDIISKTSVDDRQLHILTTLNFFSEFGKNKYLLSIIDMYNLLGKCKTLKKDKIASLNIREEDVRKCAEKETPKQYSNVDKDKLVKLMISGLENKPLSIKEQIVYEQEYLGNIMYKNPKAPKDMYYVLECKFYKDKTKPYLMLYNMRDGEYLKTKITSGKSFIESPFIAGNVINVKEFGERNKMKKVGGDWIKTDEKERIVKKWDVY